LNTIQDAAGLAVEPKRGVRITDVLDDFASHLRDIHVRSGSNLARNDANSRGDKHLAGDAPSGVRSHYSIKHGIRDLIGNFVGMAFSNGFRREYRSDRQA
jgi:hypothetical protein